MAADPVETCDAGVAYAALAHALICLGRDREAGAAIDHSFFRASWLPMVHAAVSLHRGNPALAVERLRGAERVELGINAALWPAYLRGLAYLNQGADTHALREFQKILDNKGVLAPKGFNPAALTLYPLAYLGRARAAAHSGDVDASRLAYKALLGLWQDADSNIAIVGAARREYRQLGIPRTAGVQSSKKPRARAS